MCGKKEGGKGAGVGKVTDNRAIHGPDLQGLEARSQRKMHFLYGRR